MNITLVAGNNTLNETLTLIPAPTANLSVTVKDSATGLPISGVQVSVAGQSAYTDNYGLCSFVGITPGSYNITFTKAGYE